MIAALEALKKPRTGGAEVRAIEQLLLKHLDINLVLSKLLQ